MNGRRATRHLRQTAHCEQSQGRAETDAVGIGPVATGNDPGPCNETNRREYETGPSDDVPQSVVEGVAHGTCGMTIETEAEENPHNHKADGPEIGSVVCEEAG